jgi:hypothetical protein
MGFEATIPVVERAKMVHAFEHAASVMASFYITSANKVQKVDGLYENWINFGWSQ